MQPLTWLTQNKEWLFSGIGITVFAVLFWLLRKLLGSSPAATPAMPSSALTQSPAITVSPTINLTQVTAALEKPTASPVTQKGIERELPSIQCVQSESRTNGDRRIIVAVFKNVPKSEVGQRTSLAEKVTAHLTYSNPEHEDEKRIHVNFGTWVEHTSHFAIFRPGETNSLIVALRKRQQLFALDNPNSSDPWNRFHPGQVVPEAEEKEIPWENFTVEISLVDHGVTLFHSLCRFESGSEGWSLTPV